MPDHKLQMLRAVTNKNPRDPCQAVCTCGFRTDQTEYAIVARQFDAHIAACGQEPAKVPWRIPT